MAKSLIILLVIFLFCKSSLGSRRSLSSTTQEQDDGICKSMVEPRGYACEEHTVTTKDGYILSLQRIPPTTSSTTPPVPVLLQHGIVADGEIWLLLSPESSLAFNLADNGYQVWIVSNRGTKYSYSHTSLSPTNSTYWNWSWDQLVSYDLSATLQHVHNQTGQKMHYIGHSQGTLMALAGLSKKEYLFSDMLRSAALLSPIAYLNHIKSALTSVGAYTFSAEVVKGLGINEFDTKNEIINNIMIKVCKQPGVDCTNMWTATSGPNCCLNPSIVSVYLASQPQPTSVKNMIHLSQMIRSGKIEMYDYNNVSENMKHYGGKSSPPAYDMSAIPGDFPLMLNYGGNDALADVQDVNLLLNKLPSKTRVLNYVPNFAHLDFMMSDAAKQLVYDPIIAFFKLH